MRLPIIYAIALLIFAIVGYTAILIIVNRNTGKYNFELEHNGKTVGKIELEIRPCWVPMFAESKDFPYYDTWWIQPGYYTVTDIVDSEFKDLSKHYVVDYNRVNIFSDEYYASGRDYTEIEFIDNRPALFGFGDERMTYFKLR